jgi:hypothetical protein
MSILSNRLQALNILLPKSILQMRKLSKTTLLNPLLRRGEGKLFHLEERKTKANEIQ